MVDWSSVPEKMPEFEQFIQTLVDEGVYSSHLSSLTLGELKNLIEKVQGYIKRSKINQSKTKNKHLDEMNKLREDYNSTKRKLEHKMTKIEKDKSRLEDLAMMYLKEISHLNHPLHSKNRLINEGNDSLPKPFLEKMRRKSEDSKTISRLSQFPAYSGPLVQSLLPHEKTDSHFLMTQTKFGDIWQIWDKDQTTGDTSRVVFSNQSISAALCDGAGSTGIAGMLYSRILSSVVVEKIPMSRHSLHVLTGNPMRRTLLKSLRFKNDGSVQYTPLFRSVSNKDAESLNTTLVTGKSTALNVIIHEDGLFWYSSVGDCQLHIIRCRENQPPKMIPIYTTSNESDNTELIGLGHQSDVTRSSEDNGSKCYLEEGDILVMLTDHISSFASKFMDEFAFLVDSICNAHDTFSKSNQKIQLLFKQIISSLDTSDDISALFFRMSEVKNTPPREKIGWSNEGIYIYQNRKYEPYQKNYYFDNEKTGLKRINKYVASNLLLILQRFNPLPDFLPDFNVYQSDSGSAFYIVINHLTQDKYTRLDEAIQNITCVDEVVKIQNLLFKLEKSMSETGLIHCDIAPTNIFLSKSRNEIKVVDLDTLYCDGCFPLDVETGHKGMYGDSMLGYVPSNYIHKFPFLVLQFTLEIIKSYKDQIKDFVKKNIIKTSDEIYLLKPEDLDRYFNDNQEEYLEKHVTKLMHQFPNLDSSLIENYLRELRQMNIYSID
tara:strand:+ start:1915 stop:4059 length:2145 start_codon:yes stop_codon:yes gene_type:complete